MLMRTSLIAAASLTALCTSMGVSARDDDHDRASPALVAARGKFFAAENVDSTTGRVRNDRVIISWFTNSSYAVSIEGRVFLLDSFVTRLEVTPGRTPIVIQDLVDLHPEAILLGHGHFDHADNAAFLAKTLNIPIFTSPETCDAMQGDAARIFGVGTTVNCVALVSRGSIPGTEVVTSDFFAPQATMTVFKHLHSTRVPTDSTIPQIKITNDADPREAIANPPGTPGTLFPLGTSQNSVRNLGTVAGVGGAISLFYHFRVREAPHFTFVWHNTTGALKEGCALPNNVGGVPSQPGQDAAGCFGPAVGQHLAGIMESLPKIDVQIGSVVSLGFDTNGERDTVTYTTHLRPQIFIPAHVTAVAKESSSLRWKIGYQQELDAMGVPQGQRPELRWLVDPDDYLRPMVFDPKDERWNKGDRDDD